jgi:hypothetical protein
VNYVANLRAIERHSKISVLCNMLCMKRSGRMPAKLRTGSRPCATADTRKRGTDNDNHAGIAYSKYFSRMKHWFSLPICAYASVLVSRPLDNQVATVLQIAVRCKTSAHSCIVISFHATQSRLPRNTRSSPQHSIRHQCQDGSCASPYVNGTV